MALAKYAEDNLEMYYERMAMTEHTVFQDYKPSYSTEKTVPAKNEQKKRDDEFRAMFVEGSCFM